MMKTNKIQRPRQRLSYKNKNRKWRIENVDFADSYSFYNNNELRKDLKNKITNLNLYNGIVNIEDLQDIVNPYHIDTSYQIENLPHIPIIVPKINLLVGEEASRKFDYNVVVVDPDAVSVKKDRRLAFIQNALSEIIASNYSEDEIEAKLKELDKYLKYTWKDLREKMANQILTYYWTKNNLAEVFNEGFKDALIFGEESYLIDIVHDEVLVKKINPMKIGTMMSGNSERYEDASVIIIEDYKSPHQIIDDYHDELKPEDIDYLLEYGGSKSNSGYHDDNDNHVLFGDKSSAGIIDGYVNMLEFNGHLFSSNHTDDAGNIRELKVRWKSARKVKRIKYFDEFGSEKKRFESEEYTADEMLGEEETTVWINEAWEGTKIGKDLYIKMKPMSVQYLSVANPSKCHLGIVGQIYSTGQGKAVSLVDRAKNLQYLYDIIWDRLNKAIASNHGKILELDLAKVPSNWEIDKWMHFAFVNKIAVVDSFKEGNSGASTGKLAGSSNTIGGRAIDMDNGNYIQQHIQLLEFIKMEMSEIVGVTKQREGQISNRETVGAVERSVNQSSHITEYWFMKHEGVKVRVLTALLEAAKIALSQTGNMVVQNILDDQTSEVLDIDVDEFSEADYGIFVTNSSKYAELEQLLKQNAQGMLQSGGSITTLMDIMFSPSIMDMRRKIETSEEEANARAAEAQQSQAKQAEAMLEQARELENAKLELKRYEIDVEDDRERYIANLTKGSNNNDGIADPIPDRDGRRLDLDIAKAKSDQMIKIKALEQDMIKHDDKIRVQEEANDIARLNKKKST